MFTGIIADMGRIRGLDANGQDIRLTIEVNTLEMHDVKLGDSIACNGVCLTVTEFGEKHFCADVSPETIQRTAFASYQNGDKVNLEKALQVSDRLGGHIVSGHVDGVGRIQSIQQQERWLQVWVEAPQSLAKYIAEKGSITVDGVSLTVNEVNGSAFRLTLIPQTLQETLFSSYNQGATVNLEVDLLARYLERLLTADDKPQTTSSINLDFLAEHGFVKTQ